LVVVCACGMALTAIAATSLPVSFTAVKIQKDDLEKTEIGKRGRPSSDTYYFLIDDSGGLQWYSAKSESHETVFPESPKALKKPRSVPLYRPTSDICVLADLRTRKPALSGVDTKLRMGERVVFDGDVSCWRFKTVGSSMEMSFTLSAVPGDPVYLVLKHLTSFSLAEPGWSPIDLYINQMKLLHNYSPDPKSANFTLEHTLVPTGWLSAGVNVVRIILLQSARTHYWLSFLSVCKGEAGLRLTSDITHVPPAHPPPTAVTDVRAVKPEVSAAVKSEISAAVK